MASLVVQWVKNPLVNAGDADSIPGLGRSPEMGMATHSSSLDQRIPWTEEPGRLQSIRVSQSQIRLSQVRSSSTVEAKAV